MLHFNDFIFKSDIKELSPCKTVASKLHHGKIFTFWLKVSNIFQHVLHQVVSDKLSILIADFIIPIM